MPLWTQVSSKEFLTTLINLLKTRDSPEVSAKILFLIEKWGKKFEKYQEILPNFTEVYKGLKSSNVFFPDNIHSTYARYLMSNEEIEEYNNDRTHYNNNYNANEDYIKSPINPSFSISYSQSIKADLRQSSYEKKYHKLVDKLVEWINSIEVLNEKVDKPGGRVDDTMKSIATSLRHGNKQLVDTISSEKLKDENLMKISLSVAEDVNRTLKRYDILVKGRKPEPFLSYFVESNAKNSESTSSSTRKEPIANANMNMNNPFDIFEGFDANNISDNNSNQLNQFGQQKTQMNTSNQKNNETVNDLFDIFSNPQPMNSNQNNSMGNMQFNQNNVTQPPNNQQQYPYMNNSINPIDEVYLNNNQQIENKPNDLFVKMNLGYNQDKANTNYASNYNNNNLIGSNMNYNQINEHNMNHNNQLYNSTINSSPNQIQMGINLIQQSNLNGSIEINQNNNQMDKGYNINNQFNSQSSNFGLGINHPSNQSYNQYYNMGDNNQQQMINLPNDNKTNQDKLNAIDLLF